MTAAKQSFIGQMQRPGMKPENIQITGDIRYYYLTIVSVIATSYTATQDLRAATLLLVDDDTAGGIVTIALPPVISNTGAIFHTKKLGTTANVVLDGNASETIDGATTHTISTQYESVMIICDGDEWHIV